MPLSDMMVVRVPPLHAHNTGNYIEKGDHFNVYRSSGEADKQKKTVFFPYFCASELGRAQSSRHLCWRKEVRYDPEPNLSMSRSDIIIFMVCALRFRHVFGNFFSRFRSNKSNNLFQINHRTHVIQALVEVPNVQVSNQSPNNRVTCIKYNLMLAIGIG